MGQRAVIIGASHAGSQLALSLRQEGWTGPIQLIGSEQYFPYHRPPLSKDYLSGHKTIDELLIRPPNLYQKNNIEVLLNATVEQIDRASKTLLVDVAGEEQQIGYDKLALCTGARVRLLDIPGIELPGVHYLRTLADVEAIRADLPGRGKGIIIGGGYIGLEMAAMLNKMGYEVSVLEVAPQLLGRVAAREIGEFYQALHRSHGVNIQTRANISSILGTEHVTGVELTDGSPLPCDFIVVGIGVLPNQELAADSGLETDNGIVVNELTQTSDPDIVAAGDCTRFYHPLYGSVRLESVPNATEQAKVAAATLCGKTHVHHGVPWFWSDQYDCKLQIAGLSQGYDHIIVRGSSELVADQKPGFCVFYLKAGKLIAADCINRPREFMLSKMWLQKRHTPALTKLADDQYALGKED